MTQEDKELLLKDLCARFPYGVICADRYADEKFINKWNILAIDGTFGNEFFRVCISNCEETYGYKTSITNIKPYLFPLSSMTEEQRKEYESIIYSDIELHPERYYNVIDIREFESLEEFYNKNHLDYRGLIPMGLAIDCTNLNIY